MISDIVNPKFQFGESIVSKYYPQETYFTNILTESRYGVLLNSHVYIVRGCVQDKELLADLANISMESLHRFEGPDSF